jgi:5'-3' exonuclease
VSNDAIKQINLAWLSGKVITIDTSIYLYRFLGEDALMENIYIMISLFRYYNITPIFVFDGKSPIEKAKLLEKRYDDKASAEYKYNELKNELCFCESNKKKELLFIMQTLKKKFVRLKKIDIKKVQELMDAYNIIYIVADGESDQLCSKLVQKKVAYACLSEDMDMFVYGCPRVLRYLSLVNETVVIYYLDKILYDLNIPFKEFKEICVVSGTDYNLTSNKNNLYKTLEYYKQFKSTDLSNKNIDFYTWLEDTSDYIDNIYTLYNSYNLFHTNNIQLNIKKLKIINERKLNIDIDMDIDMDKVKELMEPDGFIFM